MSNFDRKSLSLVMNSTVSRMLRQDEIVVPVLGGENAKCFLTKFKKIGWLLHIKTHWLLSL